jgi:hypothetical protein
MTDIYDQATFCEIRDREIALQQIRYSANPLPQGNCNSCGASCIGCFCDKDCRGQYEKEQRMDKINGRA